MLPSTSRKIFHRVPTFAVSTKIEEDTTSTAPTTITNSKTSTTNDNTYSFIQTELRGAAMKLHTKSQSPKEGEVEEEISSKEPYVTTPTDYLAFLIDSQHVYQAMEEIVHQYDVLTPFRNTGLERVVPLEHDILYMIQTFDVPERPSVGPAGRKYAQLLQNVAKASIPAFMCHYYNHYFAHTAGGRMIGKQMSALLLNKKTLEFYKVRQSS
jgi:heme oxygenase